MDNQIDAQIFQYLPLQPIDLLMDLSDIGVGRHHRMNRACDAARAIVMKFQAMSADYSAARLNNRFYFSNKLRVGLCR